MTSTPSEATEMTATELAATIARGERSALDVVEAHIARIEAVNPRLNAVVVKRYDAARAEAREADRKRASGAELGPLHGVPVTVKECLDLEGTPSTFGIPSRAKVLAERDDAYVARLRRAGAIVVGKTNVAQILMFVETDNPLYGRTCNPYDLERSSGGSSGGEGAILAAGGSALGLGTDIGGSVRVPAAFCGLASMKPTTGRFPDAGLYSAPIGQRAIVSQVGVLARSVADVALGMGILEAGRDPEVDPAPALSDPAKVDLAGLRVGFFTDDGVFAPSPASARAVSEAVATLERAGASVVPFAPPDTSSVMNMFFRTMASDALAGARRALGGDRRDRRITKMEQGATAALPLILALLKLSGRRKLAAIVKGSARQSVDDYFQLVETIRAYRRRFAAACASPDGAPLDLVICPAFALPAVQHGATEEVVLAGSYTCLYNVLGWPAGVVSVTEVKPGEDGGRDGSGDVMDRVAREAERGSVGLPVGVQVVARPFREHVALAAMEAIERAGSRPTRKLVV